MCHFSCCHYPLLLNITASHRKVVKAWRRAYNIVSKFYDFIKPQRPRQSCCWVPTFSGFFVEKAGFFRRFHENAMVCLVLLESGFPPQCVCVCACEPSTVPLHSDTFLHLRNKRRPERRPSLPLLIKTIKKACQRRPPP